MDCVLITNNFPPIIDGVGDYTHRLARELRKNNIRVCVICKKTNDLTDRFSNDAEVYPIVTSWTPKGFKEAFKTIDSFKPRYIIWQYVPYAFNRFGLPFGLAFIFIALKTKGYNLVTMFHEVATRLYEINPRKLLVSLGQLMIAQTMATVSRFNLTSTRFNEKQLPLVRMKLLPIPNNFANGDQEHWERVLKNTSSQIRIGCFANRVDVFFAQVINELLKDGQYEIVLMGKQNEKYLSTWKEYSFGENHRVIITGLLSNIEMGRIFSELDLFIHAERVDHRHRGGVSLKNGSLAAAFCWGLPVVTSRGDMTDECLVDEENVLFVGRPREIDGWVKTIKCATNNQQLSKEVGFNAQLFYRRNLGWDKVAGTYSNMIKTLN